MAESIPKKPREIHIKLHAGHLKIVSYLLIILILVGVIIAQQYGWIPTRNSASENLDSPTDADRVTSAIVGPIEEENETTASEPEVIEVVEETEEDAAEIVVEEEDEEETLAITGDLALIIDDVAYEIKGDDYARVLSVTYTIINQDKDLAPTIKGQLKQYGEDDEKIVELKEIEAGTIFSKTDEELTWGYNNIDDTQEVVLMMYDEDGEFIKTAIYPFDTEE